MTQTGAKKGASIIGEKTMSDIQKVLGGNLLSQTATQMPSRTGAGALKKPEPIVNLC